jgi:hypothetical protein
MSEEDPSRKGPGRSGTSRFGIDGDLDKLNTPSIKVNPQSTTDEPENKEGEAVSKDPGNPGIGPLTERAIRRKIKTRNKSHAEDIAKAIMSANNVYEEEKMGKKKPELEESGFKKKSFVWFLGLSALVVAGCAAFFSVRGISLLFSGSIVAVTIMAGGLEFGKLVAASYLYRYWKKTSFILKSYLFLAISVLVGITSMGIYGFLSDAFEKTRTQVTGYEIKISSLEQSNKSLEDRIESAKKSTSGVSEKADEAIEGYKNIYESFISQQNIRRDALISRRAELDAEVADLESQPGGLFSSKKKKLAELAENQKLERDSINSSLDEIEKQNKEEYDKFTTRVEDYRSRSEAAVDELDVSSFHSEIQSNNDTILIQRELIAETDIGSFKFIAKAFGIPLEDVVKYFILFIVVVFDPLSVTLVLAYNVALKNKEDTK